MEHLKCAHIVFNGVVTEIQQINDTHGRSCLGSVWQGQSHDDENSLSEDGSIYIRTSEDTEIADLAGNAISKDKIAGKNILAFYQIVLTSYPGQTGAEKIIVTDHSFLNNFHQKPKH